MEIKNFYLKQNRVKSSIKPKIPYKDRNLFYNISNISTSNTCTLPKYNNLSKNKVYKPRKINTPFLSSNKKKEKLDKKQIIKKPEIKLNIPAYSADAKSKKYLRAKLCHLMHKSIVLCEKKFHPRKFTESISSNIRFKDFKNKFKNFNDTFKVGIFTNKYPSILNFGDKFYSRYFDYFMSPDELLVNNFNKKEIFQIKTEPNYYNIDGIFNDVNFFKKKNLKDVLNEEEKIGINNIMESDMNKSLNKTKRKIKSYLNYYTHVMSKKGFIHN